MSDTSTPDGRNSADRLNAMCHCVTLDPARLKDAVAEETRNMQLGALVLERGHAMFSNVAVFISSTVIAQMIDVIGAILRVTGNPGYLEECQEHAPSIARVDHGPAGVFMGFDFHVGEGGPQVIEINTNAGGAFLNAVLGRAHNRCCSASLADTAFAGDCGFDASVIQMFRREWRTQRKSGDLRRVAIVDDRPQAQGLYPEFLLAQALFRRNGIDAVIAGPEELSLEQGCLVISGQPIDLVYNRLVDFDLSAPEHQVLRLAYASDAAVVTPNPRNHALVADKRNLVCLSDIGRLRSWGVEPHDLDILSRAVPETHEVNPGNADRFWRDRKRYFFKPFAGHASKAVYRGDKLTSSRWAEIRHGGYIAQKIALPGERTVEIDGALLARKFDVRLYTYGADVLLTAARLYQGQTTNMRTPGGGFSPLMVVNEGANAATACKTADNELREKKP